MVLGAALVEEPTSGEAAGGASGGQLDRRRRPPSALTPERGSSTALPLCVPPLGEFQICAMWPTNPSVVRFFYDLLLMLAFLLHVPFSCIPLFAGGLAGL